MNLILAIALLAYVLRHPILHALQYIGVALFYLTMVYCLWAILREKYGAKRNPEGWAARVQAAALAWIAFNIPRRRSHKKKSYTAPELVLYDHERDGL